MSVEQAYNHWASQYDTNENKTRDLEAVALRELLTTINFNTVLEIGCGTGKNTVWLLQKASFVTAVDFSEEMLNQAKQKLKKELETGKVNFIRADITKAWSFVKEKFDLVTFSLVLEHLKNLEDIFEKVANSLKAGGYMYIGELHPFKQYAGSKARFQTAEGEKVLECYTHHLSDFTNAANAYGLAPVLIKEYFDDNDRTTLPRLLSILFVKKS
ncbi:MAG: SAM-dependent methyltransferase [Chitinophagaceae bacterium]